MNVVTPSAADIAAFKDAAVLYMSYKEKVETWVKLGSRI